MSLDAKNEPLTLKGSIQEHSTGRFLVEGEAPGTCVRVADVERPLLELLDGSRDTKSVVRDGLEQGLGTVQIIGLLRRLGDAGLLEGWEAPARARPRRLEVRLAFLKWFAAPGRFLPLGAWNPIAWIGLGLLAALLTWTAFTGEIGSLLDPFTNDLSPLVCLLRLYLMASLVLSWRALWRGMNLASMGIEAQGAVLRLNKGLVHLAVDDRSRRSLSRDERWTFAWSGLGAVAWVALVGSAAFLVSGLPLFREVAAVALLTLLVDLAPYLRTDGHEIVGMATRIPEVRRRSSSYLFRRAVRNLLARRPVSALEKYYVAITSAWFLHAILTFWVGISFVVPAALDFATRVDFTNNGLWILPLAAAPALLALAVTIGLGVWFVITVIGFVLQMRLDPGAAAPDSVESGGETQIRDFLESAKRLPFFARLGQEALGDLAASAENHVYKAGSIIIRQGNVGDRFHFIRSGKVTVRVAEESGLEHDVAQLGPGDFFGETALIEGVPRTASILAVDDVSTWTLGREDFLPAVRKAGAEGQEVRDTIRNSGCLKGHPLFAGLSAEAFRHLLEQVEVQHRKADERVVTQGEPGDALYVVRQGSCRVTREDKGGGREVAVLGPGDWFGEIALVAASLRVASVDTVSDSVLIRVPRSEVDAVLLDDLAAAIRLTELATERLGALGIGEPR